MEEIGDDKPPNQIFKNRKLTQSQKQMKWMETGTVWTPQQTSLIMMKN